MLICLWRMPTIISNQGGVYYVNYIKKLLTNQMRSTKATSILNIFNSFLGIYLRHSQMQLIYLMCFSVMLTGTGNWLNLFRIFSLTIVCWFLFMHFKLNRISFPSLQTTDPSKCIVLPSTNRFWSSSSWRGQCLNDILPGTRSRDSKCIWTRIQEHGIALQQIS